MVRIVFDEQDAIGNYWGRGAFVGSEAMGYLHRPGFEGWAKRRGSFKSRIAVHKLGFRQVRVTDQLAYPRRLVVLGDSFTFGLGVAEKDRFLDLIAPELNRNGVGVINAAQTGYGVRQETAWGRILLDRLRPDHVLVCVFLGNDPADDWYGDYTRVEVVDGFRLSRERVGANTVLDRLRTRSRLWMLLSASANRTIARNRRIQFEQLLSNPNGRGAIVAPSLGALTEFGAVCHQRGVALAVALLPSPPGAAEKELAPILMEQLREIGIQIFDLSRLQLEIRADFVPTDGHWNALGHRKAANELGPLVTAWLDDDDR